MDTPEPLDAEVEEWLWSLPWAMAREPETQWTVIIKCLRDVARGELGDGWHRHDCAVWAALIEAYKQPQSRDVRAVPASELRSTNPAECH